MAKKSLIEKKAPAPKSKKRIGRVKGGKLSRFQTAYKPEYCDKVIAFGKEGYSPAQIAAKLGVGKSTLWQWATDIPAFSEAFTASRSFAQAWWEDQAHTSLRNKEFNTSLWTKVVTCRFREDYQDKQVVEQTLKQEGAPDMVDLARRIAFVLAGAVAQLHDDR